VLKPKFTITNKITAAITAIERTRGFLEAAALSDFWVETMQNRALVLEAHHTTHIEGTHLTLDQSEQLLAGHTVTGANPDDTKELLNYKIAFEFISKCLLKNEPISEQLIYGIHERLVKGVRGNNAMPGEYRIDQNCVINSITKKVIYMPPPPEEVRGMMIELVNWLNATTEINAILVSAIAQFQLVHIHPFLDGNGRTARLLSTFCLYQRGYDFKRLFTISEYYDRKRTDYYRAIQNVRENNMDMTRWLEYFCEGLSTQLQEVRVKGIQFIKQSKLTWLHNLSQRQKLAVNHVLSNGFLSIGDYQILCPEVSRRTLQREIQELVEKNIFQSTGATNKLIYKIKN